MNSALVRRVLLATATTAAVAATITLPATANATTEHRPAAHTLTDGAGHVVAAPAGLTRAVHNGFVPGGARTAAQPHSVIGTDQRVQVTNTTTFPARAVVQIKYNGSQGCTGWMISKNYLITAGHCVYDYPSKTWLSGMTFTPGANGASAPYGTCGMSAHWSFTSYVNSGDSNYDIGIIRLDCTVGYSTGWFGTWWQTASLNGYVDTIQGYPCDKPAGTQWTATSTIADSSTDRLSYTNDTYPCQSGSAVWQYHSSSSTGCGGYCVMGVHTNGAYNGYNSGVRFTKTKLDAIYALVNQG